MTDYGTPLAGKDSLVYIKRTTDTQYMLLACQVDYTFTLSQAVTSNSSKCGIVKSFAPVDGKLTVNGEARTGISPTDNALSFNDIAALQMSGDQFSVQLTDPSKLITLNGMAAFSKVDITANEKEVVKFSADFEFMEPGAISFIYTT